MYSVPSVTTLLVVIQVQLLLGEACTFFIRRQGSDSAFGRICEVKIPDRSEVWILSPKNFAGAVIRG